MTQEDKLALIKQVYPDHSEEIRIHDIKLLGHAGVVKLNAQRLKAYSTRISKHISYLETKEFEPKEIFPIDENLVRFIDKDAALAKMVSFFKDYRKMLNYLRNNAE